MSEHIPTGFHALTSYLHVDDARGFIEWAKAALGADERLITEEDGHVVHAELVIEGCVLELSDCRGRMPGQPANFHLFVPDPDAALERAMEAGGELLYEVTDHDYGERSGGIKDPFGNSWYIARVTDQECRNSSM